MMKRGIRLMWTATLAAMLGAGLVWAPGNVHAEEQENEDVFLGRSDAFQYQEGDARDEILKEAESFPSYYDLRHVKVAGGKEVSYVTPVRLQNPYGTCWGYAVVSAAESSLLSSGIAEKRGYDVNTLDLSEKQVAYFATSHVTDTNSPQYGEGVYFRDLTEIERSSGSYRYNTGGLSYMATSLFAGGVGPALEKVADPGEKTDRNLYLSYRGTRGEKAYWEVATQYDDEGNPVPESYQSMPLWYSDQDDWNIPEDYRNIQDFRIKEALVLPSPAVFDENGNYVYQPEAVDAIKKQIVEEHRAVSISFCAETYLPGQDTAGKKYMSDKWAHFTNTVQDSTHSVTIVGYDDDYPRENFNSTTDEGGAAMPEGNGAFLIKNSWGSELNDFPNNGYRHWGLLDGQDVVPYDPDAKAKEGNRATGYFWISYYDRSLNDPEVFSFYEEEPDDEYIDQMDYLNASSITLGWEEGVRMANVFTADATARLTDISVMTGVPGTTVSYEIYLLREGYETPEDGVLISSGEETFEFGGYHRITLSDPRVLAKRQKYSVVVTEKYEGVDHIPMLIDIYLPTGRQCSMGVINRGESYFTRDGSWQDLSEDENKQYVLTPYEDYFDTYEFELDNFPIKAYLEPVTYQDGDETPVFDGYLNVYNWQDSSRTTFTLYKGQTKNLTAEFRGLAKDMPATWNPVYSWEVGDEDIISTVPVTVRGGQIKVTALELGTTTLMVTAGDKLLDGGSHPEDTYGTILITINVKKPEVENFWFDNDEMVYDGEEKRLTITEVDFEDGFKQGVEGVDYQIIYENDIDAGTACVTVEGIGTYGGSMSYYYKILQAENTLAVKGKTASVKYSEKAQKVEVKDAIAYSDEGQGEKSYEKISGNAKLKVDAKTGAITVGAGLAQGSYDVKIKVSAAGDKNHIPGETEVTVKIKVTAPPPKTSYSNEWIKGKWYGKDGTQTYKPTASWKKDKKGWYYSDTSGWYPKNCWQKIDGKWYFFHANGYLAMGEYVKGWWLDAKTGACTWPYKASWHKDSKGWWYGDASGWYARNESYIIDGKKYTFDMKGYCK